MSELLAGGTLSNLVHLTDIHHIKKLKPLSTARMRVFSYKLTFHAGFENILNLYTGNPG
jgi:hypothetical protein